MKILVINPVSTKRWDEPDRKLYQEYAASGTQVDLVSLDEGPPTVETRAWEEEASFRTLEVIRRKAWGYDAIIVNCFSDPGVRAGRELTSIPVIGPGEVSLLTACSLGQKFTCLTVTREYTPILEEKIRKHGLDSRLASIRPIGVPVIELDRDFERVKSLLSAQARLAVDNDGADTLILGCTGMGGLAAEIHHQVGCPVVDPVATSVKWAEMLQSLKLSHRRSELAHLHMGQATSSLG